MKRWYAILMIVGLLFSLCACTQEEGSAQSPPPVQSAQQQQEQQEQQTADTETTQQEQQTADTETTQQPEAAQGTPVVYMTQEITTEGLMAVYQALQWEPQGRVAVKLSTGEPPASNYLRPELIAGLVQSLDGTIVECNTAYGDASGGVRDNTESHRKLLEEHGWTKYFPVDLMDAEGPDVVWPIPNGKVLKQNVLGKNIEHYDSMLVLAHFKGHPMGGYGGALKQLSIGCASRAGKALIHSAGVTDDRYETWQKHASKVAFPEAMADAALSVAEHFKGRIAYINVMKNLSVDCDCCMVAEDPCMQDIGMLASLDPVAIDQACIDLVMQSDDPGKAHFMERVTSRNGIHTIEAAAELGCGSREYELITL